jgi:hypothetical protein
VSGVCDPQTGCSNPRAASGTPCDDNNPLCVNGTCCADCCSVYDNLLDPSSGHLVQCASGHTCQPLDLSSITGSSGPPNANVCCADGAAACFDLDLSTNTLEAICCGAGESCQMTTAGGFPSFLCCAGESCLTLGSGGFEEVCCGAGTTCATTEIQGQTFGACCAEAVDFCATSFPPNPTSFGCCSGTCHHVDAFGGFDFCCPAGQEPRPSYVGESLVDVTCDAPCATDYCLVQNSEAASGYEEICCPANTACAPLSGSSGSSVGLCCPEPAQACVTALSPGSPPTYGCCSGTCHHVDVFGGFDLCCPAGQEPRLTYVGGVLVDVRCEEPCATDYCFVENSQATLGHEEICCPANTACAPLAGSSGVSVGLCCPEPAQACVTAYSSGTPPTYGCCSGSCQPIDGFSGIEFCCPAGQEPLVIRDSSSAETIACFDSCETEICYRAATPLGPFEPVCCPGGTSCVGSGFSIPGLGALGTCCSSTAGSCQTSFSFNPFDSGCCDGECQTIPGLGTSVSFCCAEGTIPTFDAATGQVGCFDTQGYCPTFAGGVTQTSLQACPDGTVCSLAELETIYGNLTVGACCPAGEDVAFKDGGFNCCPANQRCGSVLGAPICCAAGESCVGNICIAIENPPACTAGQQLAYDRDAAVVCCESANVCTTLDTGYCCPTGTTCRNIFDSYCPSSEGVGIPCPYPKINQCVPDCPVGQVNAIDAVTRGSVCCDQDKLCADVGLPGFGVCCPGGQSCDVHACLDLYDGLEDFLQGGGLENTNGFPFNFTEP